MHFGFSHMLTKQNLFGLDDSHVYEAETGVVLSPLVYDAYVDLRHDAALAGFDLRIASAYRNLARQLHIWNQKAEGKRPVLDDDGDMIDMSGLDDTARIYAILRWSALPGASRHHWGTDMDIYDAAALVEGQQLALTIEETLPCGPFFPMYQWLSGYLAHPDAVFFRPYLHDRGGVAIEPWHLSYSPIATQVQSMLTLPALRQCIETLDIALQAVILDNLEDIYERFILNVSDA